MGLQSSKMLLMTSFQCSCPPGAPHQLVHRPQWCCDAAAELGLGGSYFNMQREVVTLKEMTYLSTS